MANIDMKLSDHVTFLSLNNASRFKADIENWLPRLDISGTHLIVVDNASTDDTVSWIGEVLSKVRGQVSFYQNQLDFGGYGSLTNNLGNFADAVWVTTLHQDDIYLESHIQNHRKILFEKANGLGIICTEATSITPTGKTLYYPRGSWLIEKNADSLIVFLAHLRNHIFPFSGATLSLEALRRFEIPAGSTAFPDTELIMKMAPWFSFAFADYGTVKYRENPNSESHSIFGRRRDLETIRALMRVFFHESFFAICQSVQIKKREEFLRSLGKGIGIRIQNKELANNLFELVSLITTKNFESIDSDSKSELRSFDSINQKVSSLELLVQEHRSEPSKNIENQKTGNTLGSKFMIVVQPLLRFVPREFQIWLFRGLMRTKVGRLLLPQWDFQWFK